MAAKCSKCLGRKEILSLGNIMKTCPECKGVGYVKSEVVSEPAVHVVKVKKTRKKRLVKTIPAMIVPHTASPEILDAS